MEKVNSGLQYTMALWAKGELSYYFRVLRTDHTTSHTYVLVNITFVKQLTQFLQLPASQLTLPDSSSPSLSWSLSALGYLAKLHRADVSYKKVCHKTTGKLHPNCKALSLPAFHQSDGDTWFRERSLQMNQHHKDILLSKHYIKGVEQSMQIFYIFI